MPAMNEREYHEALREIADNLLGEIDNVRNVAERVLRGDAKRCLDSWPGLHAALWKYGDPEVRIANNETMLKADKAQYA